MPKSLADPCAFDSLTLAEDLADREGLTGTARRHFLEFLAKFDRPVRPISSRLLLIGSVAFGLAGFAGAFWHGPDWSLSWELMAWIVVSLAGIGLALGLRRAERLTQGPDPELNWRVYCLVLRPVVLAEKPGLIDRNHPLARNQPEQFEIRPTDVCRSIFCERGADFWWASVLGLWVGMFALLVGHSVFGISLHVAWLAPASGALTGPAAWGFIQWIAFQLARRNPSLGEW